MPKTHSTLSRRDFMKALGLGAAGIGAVAAVAPNFNDLDDLASSHKGFSKRAWWVKNVDKPTVEIDWGIVKRRSIKDFPCWNPTIPWPGLDYAEMGKKYEAKSLEIWPKYKGQTIRDLSAQTASHAMFGRAVSPYCVHLCQFGMTVDNSWNPEPATPESLGKPKWEGSPEENYRMVAAVLSLLGIGPMVGVVEVTEQMRKLTWTQTHLGRNISWEDGDFNSYISEDPPTYHISKKLKYAIVSNNYESTELMMRGALGAIGSNNSYARASFAKHYFEHFLRGIGYKCAYSHFMQPATPWGFFAGVGEHSRMSHVCLSPEYGNYLRTNFIVYTDLPLITSGPIDAGITKFCETCGLCADRCPVDAIPKKEVGPNWDPQVPQKWEDDIENGGTVRMWNAPGYKGWRANNFVCQSGAHCRGVCPFNTIPNGTFVHSMVKAAVSTTSIFNSFFANMEETLKFGNINKDPESWWEDSDNWFIYGTHPNLMKPRDY